MLYSEMKERSNRFKIALKIALPFFFTLFIYISLIKIYNLKNQELFLLLLLALCYIYYIFYLIYNSFKTTLIDKVTKAFNREYILSNLQKEIKKKSNSFAILLNISNINDINERYGINFGDNMLLFTVNEIYNFLTQKGFKKVPIGRYSGGYFLIILEGKESLLNHLFENLKMQLKNKNDIELKIDFSLLNINYDNNYKNIINHLFDKMNKNTIITLMKPDIYDKLVCQSIDEGKFIFLYQPILDFSTKKVTILEVLSKLHVKEFGKLSNKNISSTINRNSYEIEFYKQKIKTFTKEMNLYDTKEIYFSFNIPSHILRNASFITFIQMLVDTQKLNPNYLIFSFFEKNSYERMNRFSEIIREYKKMGFSLMLTHFAGNNATLEYIKFLDIDYASFDLDFSKNLDKSHFNALLEQYILMLKKLKILSIVKFIQTPYAYEIVQKMSANMVQGYLIGKPQKLEFFSKKKEINA